ncbi:ORF6 [Ranid herpesvirus 1]|uniref:ORF6 n=1 Tax=Ranid herpesvirus 1 TaxID=85655 RepID=Q14VV2_9VIRU|nr:ORF6 [Ranid herpesvirus 1]ABG25811.1 ORF6 [Ranid herpesvirus 1]
MARHLNLSAGRAIEFGDGLIEGFCDIPEQTWPVVTLCLGRSTLTEDEIWNPRGALADLTYAARLTACACHSAPQTAPPLCPVPLSVDALRAPATALLYKRYTQQEAVPLEVPPWLRVRSTKPHGYSFDPLTGFASADAAAAACFVNKVAASVRNVNREERAQIRSLTYWLYYTASDGLFLEPQASTTMCAPISVNFVATPPTQFAMALACWNTLPAPPPPNWVSKAFKLHNRALGHYLGSQDGWGEVFVSYMTTSPPA